MNTQADWNRLSQANWDPRVLALALLFIVGVLRHMILLDWHVELMTLLLVISVWISSITCFQLYHRSWMLWFAKLMQTNYRYGWNALGLAAFTFHWHISRPSSDPMPWSVHVTFNLLLAAIVYNLGRYSNFVVRQLLASPSFQLDEDLVDWPQVKHPDYTATRLITPQIGNVEALASLIAEYAGFDRSTRLQLKFAYKTYFRIIRIILQRDTLVSIGYKRFDIHEQSKAFARPAAKAHFSCRCSYGCPSRATYWDQTQHLERLRWHTHTYETELTDEQVLRLSRRAVSELLTGWDEVSDEMLHAFRLRIADRERQIYDQMANQWWWE